MIIRILDILSAILTVVSLNLTVKYNKAWLLYAFSCILFTTVCISKHLIGLSCMGIVLLITGIKNYIIGKEK